MSSLVPSETVIRRLRAHKLVPEHGPVRLASAGSLAHAQGRLQWQAVNPATGEPYGVASFYPVKLLAASRHWESGRRDGIILVWPQVKP